MENIANLTSCSSVFGTPSLIHSMSWSWVSSTGGIFGVDGGGGVQRGPSPHRWSWEETVAQLEQIIPAPGRALTSRR